MQTLCSAEKQQKLHMQDVAAFGSNDHFKGPLGSLD